jgi:hypothetical protein
MSIEGTYAICGGCSTGEAMSKSEFLAREALQEIEK